MKCLHFETFQVLHKYDCTSRRWQIALWIPNFNVSAVFVPCNFCLRRQNVGCWCSLGGELYNMASFVRPDTLPQAPKRLSKWEKADIRTERRTRMSKYELLREDIADRLRCPLCFCLPCVIIIFILLILIGIYVVQPYIQGKRIFIQSQSVCFVRRARAKNAYGRQPSMIAL